MALFITTASILERSIIKIWKLITKKALGNALRSTKDVKKLCFNTKNLRFDLRD
jgi:hypothetical protein